MIPYHYYPDLTSVCYFMLCFSKTFFGVIFQEVIVFFERFFVGSGPPADLEDLKDDVDDVISWNDGVNAYVLQHTYSHSLDVCQNNIIIHFIKHTLRPYILWEIL